MTRGERNNNPLNIRRVVGSHWKGEILTPIEDRQFCQFTTLEHGIRAAYQILDTYRRKYHAVCIEDIISRWAPPSENDTERYIRNVCQWTGLGGNERLTEDQWPQLIRAMARQECGVILDEDQIQRGFDLYRDANN